MEVKKITLRRAAKEERRGRVFPGVLAFKSDFWSQVISVDYLPSFRANYQKLTIVTSFPLKSLLFNPSLLV